MKNRTYLLGLILLGACGGNSVDTETETETETESDPTTTSDPTTGGPTTSETDPSTTQGPTTDTEDPTTESPTTGPMSECGNGLHEGGEACDDGNDDNTDACLDTCEVASCGDGYVRPLFEQCDDGNNIDDDLCSNACKLNTSCGDGVVQTGEECDDGNQSNEDDCLQTCKFPSCGDGFVHAGVEQCDDANTIDTDACRNSCEQATCGDGVVQEGVEQCDDGNTDSTDACAACVPAYCGDGYVQAGVEECDDGNEIATDSCSTSCTAATCGDGIVYDGVEDCDDGNDIDTDGCFSCVHALNCKQIHDVDPEATSGVYLVDPKPPFSIDETIPVACNMDIDGGGWTVFALLRHVTDWDYPLFTDVGTVGDSSGFVYGATLGGLPGAYREKIVVYREVRYQGDSLGTQWMINFRENELPFADIDEAFDWGYRDSYGNEDDAVISVCTHGCSTFRGLGMFHAKDSDFGWCGTQGSDLCPDGNNLCWETEGAGCPVDRCPILSEPETGVWFGVR